jgi:S1-C subfamily serine protease
MKNVLILGSLILNITLMFSLYQQTENDVGEYILSRYGHKVLKITDLEQTGHGTAFQVNSKLITNAHVCDHANAGKMYINGRVVHIIKQSDTTDLCMLEKYGDAASFELAKRIKPHERLYTLGYPFHNALTFETGFIIQRKDVDIQTDKELKDCYGPMFSLQKRGEFYNYAYECVKTIDAYISSITGYEGNSGSPVLNKYGEVVGVISAADGINSVFIPLEHLQEFLQ